MSRRLALLLTLGAIIAVWLRASIKSEDYSGSPSPIESTQTAGNKGEAPRLQRIDHSDTRNPDLPTCAVIAEDILGGIVEGATLFHNGDSVGITDASGQLTWPDRRTSISVTVVKDGYAKLATTLACPGPTTVSLTPEGILAGHVRARGTLRPLPDLVVRAGPFEGHTDSTGMFILRGLPPGTYQMSARGRHWFGMLKNPVTLDIGAVWTGLEIEVTPAFALDGTVRSDEGRPAEGIRVRGAGTSGVTDEHGRFTIPGVAPGDYALEFFGAAAPQQPSLLHEEVNVSVVDRDVELEILLAEHFVLEVEVADSEGAGVTSVPVGIAQVSDQAKHSSECVTGQDGRCTIGGLRRGTVELRARLPRVETRTVKVPETNRVRIDVGHTLRSLRGRVVDSDGEPVSGRMLVARAVRPEIGGAVTESEPGGWFNFVHLAPELYRLEVHPGKSLSATPEIVQEVELTERSMNDVEIILASPKRALHGVILSPNGTPVAQALVTYQADRHLSSCWGQFSASDRTTISNEEGRFTFEAVSESASLVLGARDSAGNTGFLMNHDPSSAEDAMIVITSTGFATLNRTEELRRADCWLRVLASPDCVVSAARWSRGQATLTVENLPPQFGDLRIELQCGLSPTVERLVTVVPGAGVDVHFSSE